jgi:hypothetical protein
MPAAATVAGRVGGGSGWAVTWLAGAGRAGIEPVTSGCGWRVFDA